MRLAVCGRLVMKGAHCCCLAMPSPSCLADPVAELAIRLSASAFPGRQESLTCVSSFIKPLASLPASLPGLLGNYFPSPSTLAALS